MFTIPKTLRASFRYDRRLYGDPSRAAAAVITKSFRAILELPDGVPGIVICIHSYGNLINHHPHLHALCTEGLFTPEGGFHPLPAMSLGMMEGLFRHRVLEMLKKKDLITPERIGLLLSWRHSGFQVDASVRVEADDGAGRENLARYLVRAPLAAVRLLERTREGTVSAGTQ